MTHLPHRIFPLPFIVRGKHLFSVPLRLAVSEASLPDVLGGRAARELAEQSLPSGVDGMLLRCVADPGWRTHTVHDNRIAYVLTRDVWHYLAWAGCYDRFLEGRFSAKTRESFERDEARFIDQFGRDGAGAGRLDLREYSRPGEIAEFRRHAAAIGATGGVSGIPGADIEPGPAAERGELKGFVLFADSMPVACVCLLASGETLQYVCSGERDDFRQWSAGTITHLQAFQRLFADPRYRYVDFRPGESELKRQFANGALRSAVVLNLRPTLRNRLLLAAYGLSSRSSGAGGAGPASDLIRAQLALLD